MAWQTRSLAEISASVRGAFRQWLPGTDSALKNNFVTVVAKVLALITHEYELRVERLIKNWFLTTAEKKWLERLCSEIGIYRKQPASASGRIVGTGASLIEYPAGIVFISGSNSYQTSTAATAASDGTLIFSVVALEKGAAGNRDAGGQMQLSDVGGWPDLSEIFEVNDAGLGGGADEELDEDLRARGLQQKRNPKGAGTLDDYERAALAVSGVIKAWAYRVPNYPGAIRLYFLFRGRTNFIPEAGDVAAVQAAIDATRLIRVDDSLVVAPVAHPIDYEIADLVNDTPDIRAAIAAAMAAMYLAKGRPGLTGDPFVVDRSWIEEAISSVQGEVSHTLVNPAGNITLTGGAFPVVGVGTYS